MTSLYSHKDSNIRKTWFLFVGFFVFIIGLAWFFSYTYNSPEILLFAVVFTSAMSIISYWYSDKIVLRMADAHPIELKDNPELYRIVENLSITAGLPMPKLYIINEDAPNAFATGRNPDNSVVAVTTGLLRKLNRSELEGVIAHELSHIGNRDMLVGTVAVILVGFVALLSDFFLRMSFRRGDNERSHPIVLLISLALAILAPISATLIQLAISRKREYLADASGALLTRYPEGLASALKKISGDPTPLPVADDASSHLWLVNPFKEKKFLHTLFMTHPPVEDRINALIGMKNENHS